MLEITAWLRENITPIKTPTFGSYNLKHVVERATGKNVANGEFIAAALIAGYAFKYTAGPNPLFGMSKRDVKRINAAARFHPIAAGHRRPDQRQPATTWDH